MNVRQTNTSRRAKIRIGNIGSNKYFLNVTQLNHKLNTTDTVSKLESKDKKRDTATITPMGKTNSLIESLMKQKQDVFESKNELITSTLKNDGTMTDIKTQLESYEEQLKNIDTQIAKTIANSAEQSDEKKVN